MIVCQKCLKPYSHHNLDHKYEAVHVETLILERLDRIVELMELQERRDTL